MPNFSPIWAFWVQKVKKNSAMLVSSDVQKLFFFNFEQILNIIIIFVTKKISEHEFLKVLIFSAFSVIFDDSKIEYAISLGKSVFGSV